MTIGDVITKIQSDGFSWLLIIYIVAQCIEVSKIQINPITWVLNWIGKRVNADIRKVNADLLTRIGKIETKLDDHIKESENKKIEKTRKEILEFANLLYREEKPQQEWHEFVMKKCDWYEAYCEENDIPNGIAKASIEEIRTKYSEFKQAGIWDGKKEGESE